MSRQFEIVPVDRLDGLAVVELDPPTAWRAAAHDQPFAIAIFGMSFTAKLAHPDPGAVEKARRRRVSFGVFHAPVSPAGALSAGKNRGVSTLAAAPDTKTNQAILNAHSIDEVIQ